MEQQDIIAFFLNIVLNKYTTITNEIFIDRKCARMQDFVCKISKFFGVSLLDLHMAEKATTSVHPPLRVRPWAAHGDAPRPSSEISAATGSPRIFSFPQSLGF
jgi:hypothetical protein